MKGKQYEFSAYASSELMSSGVEDARAPKTGTYT